MEKNTFFDLHLKNLDFALYYFLGQENKNVIFFWPSKFFLSQIIDYVELGSPTNFE